MPCPDCGGPLIVRAPSNEYLGCTCEYCVARRESVATTQDPKRKRCEPCTEKRLLANEDVCVSCGGEVNAQLRCTNEQCADYRPVAAV